MPIPDTTLHNLYAYFLGADVEPSVWLNTLASGGYNNNFKCVTFEHILRIKFMGTYWHTNATEHIWW